MKDVVDFEIELAKVYLNLDKWSGFPILVCLSESTGRASEIIFHSSYIFAEFQ